MRVALGFMCLLVSLAFAAGLVVMMVRAAWFPDPKLDVALGFVGFGLPMLLLWAAAGRLLAGERAWLAVLGWVCTALGGLWALVILGLMAEAVGLVDLGAGPRDESGRMLWLLLGCVALMVACGGIGIAILVRDEGRRGAGAIEKGEVREL